MKYFDYAATTPPFEEVITTIAEVMRLHYGNPSSMHRYGEDADKLLKRSREVCATALGGASGGDCVHIRGNGKQQSRY